MSDTIKVHEGPAEVEALIMTYPARDSATKRGHRTYAGLNLTVRRYGAVVGNYPSMAELAAHWPILAASLAERVRVSREQ